MINFSWYKDKETCFLLSGTFFTALSFAFDPDLPKYLLIVNVIIPAQGKSGSKANDKLANCMLDKLDNVSFSLSHVKLS